DFLVGGGNGWLYRRHRVQMLFFLFHLGGLAGGVQRLHHFVIGKLLYYLWSTRRFLAGRALHRLVVLRRRIPLCAGVYASPGIVGQLVAGDLLFRLIKDLDEFAGEVRALVVSDARDLADLSVRPIRRVGLLRSHVPGQIFVIHLLLDFAIRANGALLRNLIAGVVVEFDLSAAAGVLYGRVLGYTHHGVAGQKREKPERARDVRKRRMAMSLQLASP